MKKERNAPAKVAALSFFICSLLLSYSFGSAEETRQKAWVVLKEGIQNKNAGRRALAINALGLLRNDPAAVGFAEKALTDPDPAVRVAAVTALGQMGSRGSIPKMKDAARKDKEGAVILAGAHALLTLGDSSAYEVYYAILTGERKSGASLLDEQAKMLKDPKKMAQFGFEQGVGFIPFASLGLGVFQTFRKDDVSPVRAAAAKKLASDSDPRSVKALVAAASDKSAIVRAAALDAIANRGDASFVRAVEPKMSDSDEMVRYIAAAALLKLTAK